VTHTNTLTGKNAEIFNIEAALQRVTAEITLIPFIEMKYT
jgi:hypothetical protein